MSSFLMLVGLQLFSYILGVIRFTDLHRCTGRKVQDATAPIKKKCATVTVWETQEILFQTIPSRTACKTGEQNNATSINCSAVKCVRGYKPFVRFVYLRGSTNM